MVVPLEAPILIAVAAPAKFIVVAVALIRPKVADPVWIAVSINGLVWNTSLPVPVVSLTRPRT